MRHHIIVKFNSDAPDLETMLPRIKEIFSSVTEVEGVRGFELIKNCIDRPNRSDLMIAIDMDKDSLEAYDNCAAHHTWKDEFSRHIESKAIFDCE